MQQCDNVGLKLVADAWFSGKAKEQHRAFGRVYAKAVIAADGKV